MTWVALLLCLGGDCEAVAMPNPVELHQCEAMADVLPGEWLDGRLVAAVRCIPMAEQEGA